MALFAGIACLQVRGRLAGRFGAVMTRYAVGRNASMIKSRTSPCCCRFVAIFAGIVRRYVVHRFAGRLGPIVTTDAIASDTCMVEGRVAKIVSVVAVFAAIARLRVVDRFANSLHAIMTGRAGFGYARVVEPRNRPFPRGMTAITFCLGHHMVAGLAGRSDIVVAACTSFRSACKNSALVTRVTCHFRMCTGKRESGRKMVELFLGDSRRRKAAGKTCRHQNCEKR